jgi:hypothetical protein
VSYHFGLILTLLVEIERAGKLHVATIIEEADVPIVFTKPGTYDIGGVIEAVMV